jgi:hypothetical protein
VLELHHEGLEQLEQPRALILPAEERPAITRPSLPPTPSLGEGRFGIWIHEEDLLVEQSPLASLKPVNILATGDTATWLRLRYPKPKIAWLRSVLTDAAQRAGSALGVEARVQAGSTTIEALLHWATEHQLQQIAAMRPEIGPLHDQLQELRHTLTKVGVELLLFDRLEDLALRPLATGGFFGFWEKMQKSPFAGDL